MRKALWDTNERKRLYHEAVQFLRLRGERGKYARKDPQGRSSISAPAIDLASGPPSNP